jgi:TPR repeat protein
MGERQRRRIPGSVLAQLAVAAMLPLSVATAGPWEDGRPAYNRGDYIPAIQLLRPLATQGNARAQKLLGRVYHHGDATRNSVRAFMWYEIAASQGDLEAAADRDVVARDMTAEQLAEARIKAQECLASHYKRCR